MRILIAEDNLFYRRSLGGTLREWGYDVIEASDGYSAWDILRQPDAPRLAILDWVMPRMDGLEVCRRLRALQRPEPSYLIILTSKEGRQNIITALEGGADDYITKPFDREELHARLRVGRRIVDLQTTQMAIFTFARAVDAKSPYTKGHSDRVTAYALALADHLGVTGSEREILCRGGQLHDIGKISIPEHILDKPGKLTPEEFDVIKQHPLQGVKMVESLQSLRDTLPIIRWHHERLDGKGYPDGIQGEQIPFLVRIVSVADVYDALASDRPYRAAMAHTACLEVLRQNAAGGGLDPELVARFEQIAPECLQRYASGAVESLSPPAPPALALTS
jgi:putative two-component system response regulator